MNEALHSIRALAANDRMEQASEACRSYLETHPNDPAALNMMAGIASELGRHDEAIPVMVKLVEQFPTDAALGRNLGYLYSVTGNDEDAFDCYQKVLRANPEDPETLNRVGSLHLKQGRLTIALDTFREAKRIEPNIALTRRNLGEVLLRLCNLPEALSEYRAALRLSPTDPAALNGQGAVLMAQGKHAFAIQCFEAALQHRESFIEATVNLALTLTFVDRTAEAITHGRAAVELRPESAAAHACLAAALRAAGESDQAAAAFRKALDNDPEHCESRVGLGSTLVDLGQFADATEQLELAIELDPNCGSAYYHLAELARQHQYTFGERYLADLKTRETNNALSAEDRCAMHFSRAITLERQGQSTEAFQEYHNGNEVINAWLTTNGMGFSRDKHHQLIDDIIETFDDSFFDRNDLVGSSDETPIFVVGMARSGTTLVEQIIASHPEAAGAGELPFIHAMARQLSPDTDKKHVYPANTRQLSSQKLCELADGYLTRLREIDAKKERIVDKMWSNFLYLGLIAVLFPKARIVHTKRNLMDVGLSCFCRRFVPVTFPWAWSLNDIGAYEREYQRLMTHWKKVMPDRIHDVRYEDLVSDQEVTSKKLIQFCGLEWSERCSRFYESDRSVQTHSRVQVRQPIYRTSVEKWRQFETEMQPLRRALDESPGES